MCSSSTPYDVIEVSFGRPDNLIWRHTVDFIVAYPSAGPCRNHGCHDARGLVGVIIGIGAY